VSFSVVCAQNTAKFARNKGSSEKEQIHCQWKGAQYIDINQPDAYSKLDKLNPKSIICFTVVPIIAVEWWWIR